MSGGGSLIGLGLLAVDLFLRGLCGGEVESVKVLSKVTGLF